MRAEHNGLAVHRLTTRPPHLPQLIKLLNLKKTRSFEI